MPLGFTVTDDGTASAKHPPPAPPRGWYTAPDDPTHWRFWSGTTWTPFLHPRDSRHTVGYLPEGGIEPEASARPGTPEHPERRLPGDLRERIPAQSLIEKLVELERHGERAEQASWHSGAVGERYVAELLTSLGPEWTVLHSVPVGTDGSDIDHVLIGPPGVFTLNTKHHPGKKVWVARRAIRVDNQPKHYLSNAAHEADRAQRVLSKATGFTVEVVGIVVVVGASLTIRERPHSDSAQVGVVTASDLVRTVQVRREYSDEQVSKIVAAAVRPQTWSPIAPRATADTSGLLASFAEIERRLRGDRGATAASRSRSDTPTRRPPRPHGAPQRAAGSTARRKRSRGEGIARFAITVALFVGLIWAGPQIARSFVSGMTESAQKQQAEQTKQGEQAELTALSQAAGTAASAIDANSPGGVRPTALAITAIGSHLVIADSSVVLADLPDGTTASYTPTPDGLSYSLTLVGPKYATTVTVTPETGVVPG